MSKWQFLGLLQFQKLISRKFWMADKFWNFHSVKIVSVHLIWSILLLVETLYDINFKLSMWNNDLQSKSSLILAFLAFFKKVAQSIPTKYCILQFVRCSSNAKLQQAIYMYMYQISANRKKRSPNMKRKLHFQD